MVKTAEREGVSDPVVAAVDDVLEGRPLRSTGVIGIFPSVICGLEGEVVVVLVVELGLGGGSCSSIVAAVNVAVAVGLLMVLMMWLFVFIEVVLGMEYCAGRRVRML